MLSRAVRFLKSREELEKDRNQPRTPSRNLEIALQNGHMIPFRELPGTIGADPSATAVLVNQLVASGYASVVTRIDCAGMFLVRTA